MKKIVLIFLFLNSFMFSKAYEEVEELESPHDNISSIVEKEIENIKSYLSISNEDLVNEKKVIFEYDKIIKEKVVEDEKIYTK